tara:strand:- start:202 stop:645 length:444 start_codon:yes stop_codon:yes gene_type:complete
MKKSTLTREDRDLAVKKLKARGFTQRIISSRLGISHGTVSNILTNYAYSRKNKFESLDSRNAYIRKMSRNGRRNKDIARVVGLDPSTVSAIISGRRRPYLTKTKSTPKRKRATKGGVNKKAPLTLNRLTVALWVVNAIMLTYIIFNI